MTPLQKSLARHALGLPNPRMVSYRNRYAVPYRSNIYDEWVQMSKKGYAWRGKKVGGIVAFYLTREGAMAALESGESLCLEDFPPQDAATDRGGGGGMTTMRGARRDEQMIDDKADRIARCIIAIHDLATRPKATRAAVMRGLKAEGFTAAEISEATEKMGARQG